MIACLKYDILGTCIRSADMVSYDVLTNFRSWCLFLQSKVGTTVELWSCLTCRVFSLCRSLSAHVRARAVSKLQALVYDILPSTTAVFSYAIGSRKLSANEQFFVGAQTVVSLLQTTQIISNVCFITDHAAYVSSNKTKIV